MGHGAGGSDFSMGQHYKVAMSARMLVPTLISPQMLLGCKTPNNQLTDYKLGSNFYFKGLTLKISDMKMF